ncbi:hypothetical protein [Pararhodonellum marinum]|uniref:hypothetical protein n=1 Tax=Pararhodonellum marinum TaxID=2755358 RepID=UPI00188F0E9D|nr:hypothetical protein [Pararhodonellum marinum]
METNLIQSLLSGILAQLDPKPKEGIPTLENELPNLVKALRFQELSAVSSEKLSIQSADFFSRSLLSKGLREKIVKAIEGTSEAEEIAGGERIFVREVPVRSSQVSASVPDWGIGGRVDRTIGPIERIDGRPIYLDFYKVEKLVAIRRASSNVPLILFKASFQQRRLAPISTPPVEVTKEYNLIAGSVWVKADLFASSAPADRYFGLKVKSGKITLSALPTLNGNNLQVAPGVRMVCQLSLDLPKPSPKDPKKHGQDARDLSIKTPDKFNFSFGGSLPNSIDLVSDSEWQIYEESGKFKQIKKPNKFDAQSNRLLIPLQYSEDEFSPKATKSSLFYLSEAAKITQSWWGIPAAKIDFNAPVEANGGGALIQDLKPGLVASWKGLDGNEFQLNECQILAEEGRIGITALKATGQGTFHDFNHWKDKLNPHGTQVQLSFPDLVPLRYNCLAEGIEMILVQSHALLHVDRPRQVNGHGFLIDTQNSMVIFAAGETGNLFYLMDDNVLWDNMLPTEEIPHFKSLAIALENALFTISPVNGVIVFGHVDEDWKKILKSNNFLIFGTLGYLPTLPDPYLANLSFPRRSIRGDSFDSKQHFNQIQNWLFCWIKQDPGEEELDEVKVSFHFGPGLGQNSTGQPSSGMVLNPAMLNPPGPLNVLADAQIRDGRSKIPNYEDEFDRAVGSISRDFFALLDVSSNANQVGVSMGMNPGLDKRESYLTGRVTARSESEAVVTPFQGQILTIEGLEVKVPGHFARVFLLPQVAWEPVINTYTEGTQPMDPPSGFNYYPNDGGPTRMLNSSPEKVTLAPIPLTQFLLAQFKDKKAEVYSLFTLPFGLKAFAWLNRLNSHYPNKKPKLEPNSPKFPNELLGGIQLRAIGGDAGALWPQEPWLNDSDMFTGYTSQINNILNFNGQHTQTSTLGDSVTVIFNGQFSPNALQPKGVPVTTIDFSGYGASMFSDWLGPSAEIAQTSQARFDVMLGRTGHEVVQVKSLVYPWGIRVVRTITIFRASSGFIYRMDSGWQPETDGQFDFRYKFKINGNSTTETPYVIHPGTLRGLYNIRNIKEDGSLSDFKREDTIHNGQKYIDHKGDQQTWGGGSQPVPIHCRPVWFDADVELENLVQGHKNNRTPARKILGYVQLAPPGVPLSPARFRELLNTQGGSIGGDIDCVMDIAKTGQMIRITRFDFSHAADPGHADGVFVASARGSLMLPKTGSWSVVQHAVNSGDVTPLPQHIPVPLIREGKWIPGKVVDPDSVTKKLVRMANPAELMRPPANGTVNYGILQTTATQKAMLLTPSFGFGQKILLSKTPLLFADPYTLMSGDGIFPNSGNAIDEFGKAIALFTGSGDGLNKVKAFAENSNFLDGGVKVLELLEITAPAGGSTLLDQGFQMLAGKANAALDKALAFDIPDQKTYLVNMESLKIYIEYKTAKKRKNQPDELVDSKLNFDIDTFKKAAGDTWKSRLNNVAMVVDLGDFTGLMKIKGNFDAKKGKESGYEGGADADFLGIGYPSPELEFHSALQPVIDLLEILASLSQGNYADVMKKGLQIAMSNAGEIWEYKFEAKKEIPLVRFPPEENLYNSPTTPLKLEAGLELGVFFNAALKVTNDANQLVPTAGAYIQFRGGLEVMCVSVGVGTIYAIGEVILKLACDTKVGPSIQMNFGFGVAIAVGLPVIGTVSVTYMVGCELYVGTSEFTISAFLLFRGKARLAGGLVSVTIYIEAKGTVSRKAINTPQERTDCTASVTFGLDISICFVINISFEETWQESRQIA